MPHLLGALQRQVAEQLDEALPHRSVCNARNIQCVALVHRPQQLQEGKAVLFCFDPQRRAGIPFT